MAPGSALHATERPHIEAFPNRPSVERATLLHAFRNNPALAWTPWGLSTWYGIRVDRVRAILGELTEWGVIRWAGRGDLYVLNEPRSEGTGAAPPPTRSPATSRRPRGRYEGRDGEGRRESPWQLAS